MIKGQNVGVARAKLVPYGILHPCLGGFISHVVVSYLTDVWPLNDSQNLIDLFLEIQGKYFNSLNDTLISELRTSLVNATSK